MERVPAIRLQKSRSEPGSMYSRFVWVAPLEKVENQGCHHDPWRIAQLLLHSASKNVVDYGYLTYQDAISPVSAASQPEADPLRPSGSVLIWIF